MNLKDIEAILPSNTVIKGNYRDIKLNNFLSIFEADEASLIWLNPKRKDKQELLDETKAKVVITDGDIDMEKHSDKVFFIVDEPKTTFMKVVNAYIDQRIRKGIHSSAIIDEEAEIGENCYIGPNTVIEKVKIGNNVKIEGNCYIYDNSVIGNNCHVKANTVIGGDGYGFSKDEEGEWELFPHIGGVVLEDNVFVGSNTCIDRGGLGNTIIRKGAKIDNLVHIAHNVDIGERTMVIANSMIGGSVTVGNDSWIAPSASIIDTGNIGNNSFVGMGAAVVKPVPDGEIWAGVPAKFIKENSK